MFFYCAELCYIEAMEHLKGLNERQKQAALHTEGPLLIVAGAGAGKTKTITHRILNLIKTGVAPEKILAVTFTNKAAKEMRERVIAEIEKNAKGQNTIPFVSTFHALGVYIIKENARLLHLTRYFTILDESDSARLIKEILKERGYDPKQYDPGRIKGIISREKGNFVDLPEYQERTEEPGASYIARIVAEIWAPYEERKIKENSLDFDDLILQSAKLLQENEGVRKIYQDRWKYIHIDEYQDTNQTQYLLSRLLCGENKNICVVGDTDQCLAKGTKIKMADNTLKSIEDIKRGEYVLSNYGGGDFRPAKVVGEKNIQFKGSLIQIETEKGNVLVSTPDHTHFAGYRLGLTPQMYLNYLMYKKGFGWRIGTTSIYTKGQKKSVVGFLQRSNQEHADALWVISTHNTQNKARVQEYILSLKYQIPTIPFTPRKGFSTSGYVHDKSALKEIFSSFDTESSALKLLSDLGLLWDRPHHQPQTHNANRRNINITLCADRRGQTPMHIISTFGNDRYGRKKLESMGFSVRSAKKNTTNWRFETARANYGEACLLATKIASAFPEVNMIFSARLGGIKTNPRDGNSLPCLPAGSVLPGMALFTENGYDIVSKISRINTPKIIVFDLNIEKTHNFIANDIVTHNCIYSWRGANLRNILNFEKDYPAAKIVLLEENYRSTKNILSAANEVIKKNKYRPEKNLFTQKPAGEKISLYEALSGEDEADFVATKILELIDTGGGKIITPSSSPQGGEKSNTLSLGEGWGEVAVLYRANFQSRALEEAMLRYNIPYQVLGVKFFERKEVKDTLAYLRAALNPQSLSDIKRIINFPSRGIGKVTLVKIFSNETETLPIKMRIKIDNFYKLLGEIRQQIETAKASEVIKFTVRKSGIEEELREGTAEDEERLANIKELATLAIKYDNLANGTGVEKLLEDASLASDQDSIMINEEKKEIRSGARPAQGGVKLMTVHAAKGLEFKYVFIVGLEEGLFPIQRDGEEKTAEDQEEERRLFYVALTRAKHKLFLSTAQFRTIFGSRQINAPSEFLADIPAEILEREGEKGVRTIYI